MIFNNYITKLNLYKKKIVLWKVNLKNYKSINNSKSKLIKIYFT